MPGQVRKGSTEGMVLTLHPKARVGTLQMKAMEKHSIQKYSHTEFLKKSGKLRVMGLRI